MPPATGLANTIVLQSVWQWSVLTAAVAVTPSPIMAALVSPLSGPSADGCGHRVALVPGALVFALGALLYALRIGASPSYLTEWLALKRPPGPPGRAGRWPRRR